MKPSNVAIKPQSDVDIIPRKIKLAWSCGAFGVYFMSNVVAGFALIYMVSVLKIEPAIAGVVIFIPKIFDAVTDPIIGRWSDRIKVQASRRRPFMFWGAILSSVSFAMVFTTPLFENSAVTIAYIFSALMLFSIGYTLYNIPYLAMPAEMTDDYHERTSIHGYRAVSFNISGLLIGMGVPLVLEKLGKETWEAYAAIGVGGGVLIFMSMIISWAGTKNARFSTASLDNPPIFEELEHVFKNEHYLRLLLVKFCQLFGVASTIAALTFFVIYVMQRGFDVLAIYFTAFGLSAIVSVPILVKLSRSIGKSATYIIAASCYVIVVISWMLAQPNDPVWMIALRGLIIGIGGTGNVIMAMSMLTDIINYDSKIHGERREGIFTAFYSFVEKFTFAFGPLIVGVALSIAGFDANRPKEELQSPEVRQALLMGMSYIPAVMGIISIWLLRGYKLKESDLNPISSE